jgi:condensin complex subunit 2
MLSNRVSTSSSFYRFVFSCTLDAGVKIYSCKVDAVHKETFRVLGGLSTGKERQADSDDEGGENEGAGEEKKAKVRVCEF